ncbi:MerR family transcriptional regulator [Motiliproteus sp.]|uniref:MerR family transcriptional regulator n=1 Tax=Motiliproteus sp. TaxID=1898955 RepID=UPI003BA860A3
MNDRSTGLITIDDVARDTGLGKDTLRVWERRYGFPNPGRTETGERCYSAEQLQRLRLICRLINQGKRPGAVVPLTTRELQALAQEAGQASPEEIDPQIDALVSLLKAGQTTEFRQQLALRVNQQGPKGFIHQTAEPLLKLTGSAWADGQIPIYLEHYITQQLTTSINLALSQVEAPATGLRILLTTLPGEPHGMGIMMVELLMRLQGVETINIGLETPIDQLRDACELLQPHAIALSFSAIQKRPQTLSLLQELERSIPSSIEILAGGQGITKLRALPGRIKVVKRMEHLKKTLNPLIRQLR